MENKKGSIRIIILLLVFAGFAYGFFKFFHEIENKKVLSATTSSIALLTLQPASLTLPPNGTAQLVVSVGAEKVDFVHAELAFDTSKVKLAGDISISSSPLNRVVKLTSASEANSTGKIIIALALDPTKAANPPTGAFAIATLTWTANTTSSNATASVNFTTSALRVFNNNAELYTLNSHNLALTLNPCPPVNGIWTYGSWGMCSVSCGGGTQTRTATCTGAFCGGTCTEPSVTSQSCNTQICPTSSPPPSSDTTPPTVSITAPVEGASITRRGTVAITVSASDEVDGSGMAKVDFYVNSSLKSSDTSSPYSYSWKVSGKPGASYTVAVRAYDKAGNSSFTFVTVKSQ